MCTGHPESSQTATMMTTTTPKEDDRLRSWQFVPLSAYHLPAAPVTHSARQRLAALRQLFCVSSKELDTHLISRDKLFSLPLAQLERLAPSPDWRDGADALHRSLAGWLENEETQQPTILVVAPPHGGNAEILAKWAELHSWRTVRGPSREQILAADEGWLSGLRDDDSPWVLPRLESTYFRHAEGLALLRGFLDLACAGRLGRGIIGCDSWAWAFLRHLWRGRTPITLTLQAFDDILLADLFQRPVDACGARHLLFRQSDNGCYVLPPPVLEGSASEKCRFLQILAAHCRGNFGVAQAAWRASMQAEPDATPFMDHSGNEQGNADQTVWIMPWHLNIFPALPADAGRNEAFVLHTLLLHNGLPLELLEVLLPFSSHQIAAVVYRLEEAGLIGRLLAGWKVTPRGYPAVRHFLATNGYLVDDF